MCPLSPVTKSFLTVSITRRRCIGLLTSSYHEEFSKVGQPQQNLSPKFQTEIRLDQHRAYTVVTAVILKVTACKMHASGLWGQCDIEAGASLSAIVGTCYRSYWSSEACGSRWPVMITSQYSSVRGYYLKLCIPTPTYTTTYFAQIQMQFMWHTDFYRGIGTTSRPISMQFCHRQI